ncbi:MAG: AI-2E family transporter [Deltaproteobacteria bacterium]|nr:MAG: AI-2E family transporter [Deltaproteobacteria bacterium]
MEILVPFPTSSSISVNLPWTDVISILPAEGIPVKRKHFHIGAAVLFLVLAVTSKGVTVTLVLSFVLAYLLEPLVRLLERKKVPRRLSASLIYGIAIILVLSIGGKALTSVVSQAQNFAREIPSYLETAKNLVAEKGETYRWAYNFIQDLDRHLVTFLQKNVKAILTTAGQVIYLIVITVLSFFLLVNREKVNEALTLFIGEEWVQQNEGLIREMDGVVRGFFTGRLGVCVAVFLLTLVGCTFIKIKHSLFIATFTGLTAFIPYYGALGGLVPGILAALGTPPVIRSLVSVTVLIVVVNSIESNLLTPFLTARHVKLHPGVIVASVMVGGALYGFWGVVFSIPIAGVVRCLLSRALRDGGN